MTLLVTNPHQRRIATLAAAIASLVASASQAADNARLTSLKASTRDIMAANNPCVIASRKVGLQAVMVDEGKAAMNSVFVLVRAANSACDQAAKSIAAMRAPISGPEGAAWQRAIGICAAGPRLASQSYAAMERPGYTDRQMTADLAVAAQRQNECSIEVTRGMVRVQN